jgi:hypothetical protein
MIIITRIIINIIKENDNNINIMSGFDISRCANYVTSIGEDNCYAFKAHPKFADYKMKNNVYQSMLLRRLFLPQPFIPININCELSFKSFSRSVWNSCVFVSYLVVRKNKLVKMLKLL